MSDQKEPKLENLLTRVQAKWAYQHLRANPDEDEDTFISQACADASLYKDQVLVELHYDPYYGEPYNRFALLSERQFEYLDEKNPEIDLGSIAGKHSECCPRFGELLNRVYDEPGEIADAIERFGYPLTPVLDDHCQEADEEDADDDEKEEDEDGDEGGDGDCYTGMKTTVQTGKRKASDEEVIVPASPPPKKRKEEDE